MQQEIRFCMTEDGVRIAYATTGKGTPIVRPGHWLTHLQHDLESPIWGHLIEPYYMVVAVATAVVGMISYVVTKLM